ncbi:MAG: MATE family efflux transporter [Treponema sp.]|jgi:putative MATE family efflux protein|nr:MATE family efflux transporter [Treponema sp.]
MTDFTTGSITRQLLLFSLPMLLGNLFQQVYSMVDVIVVGRFVSGSALAAVGVATYVSNFLLAVLIGLTTGASVLVSQYYGAKQYQNVTRTVSTSIIFLTALSIVITILGIVFAPLLMRLLNATPDVIDDAVLYLRVVMIGMIFTIFFNMYTAYLRALGNSRGPLYILIICTFVNIALDLFFVLFFGMGVFGVALATVIAQGISALLCFFYSKKQAPLLDVSSLHFDSSQMRLILKYGFPAAIQLSLVSMAQLSITRLINSFGTAAMAGITAAAKIDQIAILPVSNFAMALSTFVGQNIGASQEDRARKGLRSALVFMILLSVLISGILFVFAPQLITSFLGEGDTHASNIILVGKNYLHIIVLFYFLFAILFAFNGFFRGSGDAVMAMIFPVASLAIRTLAAYMLVHFAGMGPEALAWSVSIGWGLTGFASVIYYKTNKWRGKGIKRTL